MAEQTSPTEDAKHVCHEQGVVDGRGQLDVTVMSGASKIVEMAGRTAAWGQLMRR